jgi:hypothetical protein
MTTSSYLLLTRISGRSAAGRKSRTGDHHSAPAKSRKEGDFKEILRSFGEYFSDLDNIPEIIDSMGSDSIVEATMEAFFEEAQERKMRQELKREMLRERIDSEGGRDPSDFGDLDRQNAAGERMEGMERDGTAWV